MIRFSFLSLLLLAGLTVSSTGVLAYTGEKLEPTAHIKMAKAEHVALKARPGTITDRELERETGGSGLRYSFDIRAHNVTYEVGVDAISGKVLENKPEGKNPD